MRVVVQITSGPSAGRKFALSAGQMLQVGRTEWADMAISADKLMSGVHFALETDQVACYVQDLGSTNGTRVNDRPIAAKVKTLVRDGDEVLAGQTLFRLTIEGDRPQEAPPIPAAVKAVLPEMSRASGIPPVGLRVPGKVGYTAEKCSSGLTLCRGEVAEFPPHELALLLCQVYPAYLIVDFKNLGQPRPAELESSHYLFDWLESMAAEQVSPLFLDQTDLLTWPSLLENGWGMDGVVCLFSRKEKPELLAHLRRTCRTKTRPDDQGGALVGYCWPSVLAPLLMHYTPEFVAQLLTDIDVVLVELPDLPDSWQLFGSNKLPGLLDQLGFTRLEADGSSQGDMMVQT